MMSARDGHLKIVKLLIAANVLVNARGVKNGTALHLAAIGGQTECVSVLLKNAANAKLKDEVRHLIIITYTYCLLVLCRMEALLSRQRLTLVTPLWLIYSLMQRLHLMLNYWTDLRLYFKPLVQVIQSVSMYSLRVELTPILPTRYQQLYIYIYIYIYIQQWFSLKREYNV